MRLFASIFWRPPDLHNVCWEDGSTAIFSPSSERWRGWGTHLLHVPRRRDSHRNRLLSLSIIPILGGFIPRGGSRKTRGVVFSARYGGKRR